MCDGDEGRVTADIEARLPLTAIERRDVTLDEAIEEWKNITAENAGRAARSRSDRKYAVLQRRYFWTLKALTDARDHIRDLEEVARAARAFIEDFEDETSDEYAVAFDNVKNALSKLDRQKEGPR